MFSFFNIKAPVDSSSSSSDDECSEHFNKREDRGIIPPDDDIDDERDDISTTIDGIIPDNSASTQSKLHELESRNKKVTKQLSSLQAIISSKTSLCLEYKKKLEESEEERIKNAEQSADLVISLEAEVAALREENASLKQQLSGSRTSTSGELKLDFYEEQQEDDLRSEIERLRSQLHSTKESLRNSLDQAKTFENELKSAGKEVWQTKDDFMPVEGGISGVTCLQAVHKKHDVKKRNCVYRSPPSLLETKLLEVRHMQWASAVHVRESAALFKQRERVERVIDQMKREFNSFDTGERDVLGMNSSNMVHTAPLEKILQELESSFEASRSFAVNLDARLEGSRNSVYADILNAIEPEIEAIDDIYCELDAAVLHKINSACSAINKSVRYRPGESQIHQERSGDGLGGSFSCEYMYSLRKECSALLPVVKNFLQTACTKCPGLEMSYEPCMKPLDEIMEDCFIKYRGDYSLVCDFISCSVTAESLNIIGELLAVIGANDGHKKRANLPSAVSFSSCRFPRYSLIAIKNKFNSNYDATSFSAGYRELCLYLRFLESPHPKHVVEVHVELKQFVDACNGFQGGWVSYLFNVARPLKIFDDPLRSHVGPIDDIGAQSIKNGITQAICLDHFPYSTSGGDILVAALSQSPYCALQDLSLHGSGISDNDLSVLMAILSIHKRLKTLRLSGERKDVRGRIRTFPWDVIELEVQNSSKAQSGTSRLPGFACIQKLDASFNMISGDFYPYISTVLPSLRTLNFDDNCLSGHLPPDLGNLSNLQHLILCRNEFTGPIPSSIGSLSSLKDLQLWQNKLSGSIPPSIGGLTNLLRLNIDSCMLSGPLPEEIGSLVSLREFYCFDNRLTGHLPTSLCGLSNLQYLGLNGNQFSGPIPSEIGSLKKLKTLFLHENAFVGTIPTQLGSLTELRKISLRGNRLQGEIPVQLGNLLNLQAISLSENTLSGHIPRDMTRLHSLEAFSVANNRLTGTLPAGLSGLKSLKLFDITKNQISGNIPAEICHLSSLRDVLFGENLLDGQIPPSIGKLNELNSLELQGNRLSGSIPTVELARMQSLRILNLSRNQLAHGESSQSHLSERLQNCDVSVEAGQRPKGNT